MDSIQKALKRLAEVNHGSIEEVLGQEQVVRTLHGRELAAYRPYAFWLAYIVCRHAADMGRLDRVMSEARINPLFHPFADPLEMDDYLGWTAVESFPKFLKARLESLRMSFGELKLPRRSEPLPPEYFYQVCAAANTATSDPNNLREAAAELERLLEHLDVGAHYDPYLATRLYIWLLYIYHELQDARFFARMEGGNLFIADYARWLLSNGLDPDPVNGMFYAYFQDRAANPASISGGLPILPKRLNSDRRVSLSMQMGWYLL